MLLVGSATTRVVAEDGVGPPAAAATADSPSEEPQGIRELLNAGGTIGWIIIALSVATVALIVEHLISIRRGALLPIGLAEESHQLINQGRFTDAEQIARNSPSFLGHVLASGLAEVSFGYKAAEKAMEDASVERAARLFRKIEYLSIIGTIAPMLGLLGTVLGMIAAFDQFKNQASPQVSQFAPGISHALVTTAMGIIVAVPALAGYAIFRNRIDGLVAESTLMAEHLFSDFKRRTQSKRKSAAAAKP
jgi:biopolymer transport protein ExbB